MSAVEERFRRALAQQFYLEPRTGAALRMDQKFTDLGDSLDFVEAIMVLEDEFGISISDDRAEVAQAGGTLQALLDAVTEQVQR